MPARSFLLLAFVCLLWALNVVVTRLMVAGLGVPPLWFAAIRSAVVMMALMPWLLPLPPRWPWILLVCFMISGGSFALLFEGLQDATPASAAVVSLSGAPLTVLFAILILREEVRWRRGLGIALTFTGVGIAVASPTGWANSIGLAFVFASAVVGALGSVLLKRIELDAIRLQALAGAISAAVLFPLSFAGESGQVEATLHGGFALLGGLAFSALAVSVFAHTVYFAMLKTYDANLIAPLTLMTPIMTMGLGASITGDEVGPYLVLGATVAAAGVLIIVLRPSRNLLKGLLVRSRL